MSGEGSTRPWTPSGDLMYAPRTHGACLLAVLRARLPATEYRVWFGCARVVSDTPVSCVIALPNRFTRDWVARHFDDELRRWAASTGRTAVELVVDPSPPRGSPPEDDERDREARIVEQLRAERDAHQRSVSNGVVVKLLAERGFWSLSPSRPVEPYELEDLGGVLEVLPSARGAAGIYEACVFTGLVSL